jgi:hypothetical protein
MKLLELAAIEREIAKRIADRPPAYRHDPEAAEVARIALLRAEALEAMANS